MGKSSESLRPTPLTRAAARKLNGEGWSPANIANALRVDPATIYRWLDRAADDARSVLDAASIEED